MNFTVKNLKNQTEKLNSRKLMEQQKIKKINRKVYGFWGNIIRHVERSILCLYTHSDEQQTQTDSKIETTRQVANRVLLSFSLSIHWMNLSR